MLAAAAEAVGAERVDADPAPVTAGEDFAYMMRTSRARSSSWATGRRRTGRCMRCTRRRDCRKYLTGVRNT